MKEYNFFYWKWQITMTNVIHFTRTKKVKKKKATKIYIVESERERWRESAMKDNIVIATRHYMAYLQRSSLKENSSKELVCVQSSNKSVR